MTNKATHLYIGSDGWKMWFWWKRVTTLLDRRDWPAHHLRIETRQDGYAFARGRTD